MNNRTFLLGVGAQKAGTSWLYQYLIQKNNTNLGFTKEYHIWDAVNIPECNNLKAKLSLPLPDNKIIKIWLMQNIGWYYFRYFRSLLETENINLTADIGPSLFRVGSSKTICNAMNGVSSKRYSPNLGLSFIVRYTRGHVQIDNRLF